MKTAHFIGVILPQTPTHLTQLQRMCKIFWAHFIGVSFTQTPARLTQYYVSRCKYLELKNMILWIGVWAHKPGFNAFCRENNQSQFTRFWGKFLVDIFICVKKLTLCNSEFVGKTISKINFPKIFYKHLSFFPK